MAEEKRKHITFQSGLIENLDDYKIDEDLYHEIPVDTTSFEGNAILKAIQKSDKLAIRQSARIAHSVQRFDKKSTILTGIMIVIIFLQLIVLVVQLTTLHF